MNFKEEFRDHAFSVGTTPERLSDALSVACFESELRELAAAGGRPSRLIPTGARRTMNEIGVFVRKGVGGIIINMERVEYLLATPGLPSYMPGDYAPHVAESELSTYRVGQYDEVGEEVLEDDYEPRVVYVPF